MMALSSELIRFRAVVLVAFAASNSGAPAGRARLYTRIGPKMPCWNTRTSFRRIISSSARNVTIMPGARLHVGEQLLEAAGLGFRQPREQLLDARLDRNLLGRQHARRGRCRARSSTCRNAAIRLKRSTSISGSGASPTTSATRPSGRPHCALRWISFSCSSSAAALNLWCSSSRRTSASRGSSSASSCAGSGRGSSIRDLMWMSVAAITRNSPATSRFSSCIRSR